MANCEVCDKSCSTCGKCGKGMRRGRPIRVGDLVEHTVTGRLLGSVSELRNVYVRLEPVKGSATRDGEPLKMAGYTEIRPRFANTIHVHNVVVNKPPICGECGQVKAYCMCGLPPAALGVLA